MKGLKSKILVVDPSGSEHKITKRVHIIMDTFICDVVFNEFQQNDVFNLLKRPIVEV